MSKVDGVIKIMNDEKVICYSDENELNVDIESTIKKLGISIAKDPLGPEDRGAYGKVFKDADEHIHIAINLNLSGSERKITLAHELGHALLHFLGVPNPSVYKDAVFYRKPVYKYNIEEREANEFASKLLMPDGKFSDYVYDHVTDGAIDLKRVAKAFGVSVGVARAKAVRLDIIDF